MSRYAPKMAYSFISRLGICDKLKPKLLTFKDIYDSAIALPASVVRS